MFIWNSNPNPPPVVPAPVIGPDEVSFDVHVVANTVNVHGLVIGTLSYNTANEGYDVIYELPSLNVRNLHAQTLTAIRATINSAFINTATINNATINTANISSATIANGIMGVHPVQNLQIATKEYVDTLIANSVPQGGNLQLLIIAAGDLLVGIADNTAERLPIGTLDRSVLIAGSDSNTGVRWSTGTRGSISTHRGLYIGTSFDSQLRNTHVELVTVDEVVMDDGTRISSGWNGLTAAITSNVATSGVGYIDTGVVKAQTCYEIWGVRNSSNGAQGLVLHRAIERFVDVSYRPTIVAAFRKINYALGVGLTTCINAAQSFVSTNTGPFTSIELTMFRVGSPVGNCWVTLEANTGGNASGVPLSTSRYMDAGRMPTDATGGRIRFVFDTTANVVSGNSYWGVFHVDYPQAFVGNENHLSLCGVATEAFANGTGKQFSANTNTWQSANASAPAIADFYIRTFVESFNTDLLMPTGYDQKCLLSYMSTSGNAGGFGVVVSEYHQRGTKIETNFHYNWDINYNSAFGGGANPTDVQTGLLEVLDMRNYVPPVPCLVTFAVSCYSGVHTFTCVGALSSTDMGGTGGTPIVIESSGQICANIPASSQMLFGPVLVEHQSVVLRTHASTTTFWTAEVEY
jgi:hypothetical protein